MYPLLLLVVIGIFAAMRFGITGVRTILGIVVAFIVPVYLLLDYFDLKEDERIFFSLFVGIGIVPLIVWVVNRVIYSLKLSLVITVIVLIVAGLYLKSIKKKREKIEKDKRNA